MTFDTAIASLKQGEFVMIYDSDGRESEVDLMVAAEFCTPEHVARMRQHAGGLLCLAISNDLAKYPRNHLKSIWDCYLLLCLKLSFRKLYKAEGSTDTSITEGLFDSNAADRASDKSDKLSTLIPKAP